MNFLMTLFLSLPLLAQTTRTTPAVNGTTTTKPAVVKHTRPPMTEEQKAAIRKRMEEFRKMTPEQKKAARQKWEQEHKNKKPVTTPGQKSFKDMTPEERKNFIQKSRTKR